VQTPEGSRPDRATRIRRRDRHGRGLRGVLAPADVPLHRTRAERFDDLVLQAVARLELQWEAHLSGVEFAVEEIPPPDAPAAANGRGAVPLSRLDPGPPQRIVVYRRPLMARADGEEDLGELVFDVVVEEFARLLGIEPRDVDPGYSGGD
jgi:predicted Zn-dependent protease with MMP-like domain